MDVAGVDLEVINIYGSTEGHFGGVAVYINKSNPYFTEPPKIKPIYISSFYLGAEIPRYPLEVPEYPKNLYHRMQKGEEFCLVVTAASAFSVPNYFIGDIAVLEDSGINVIGRYIRRVSGLPVVGEAYTSPVIRASGVVIKQTFSEVISKVVGSSVFMAIVSSTERGARLDVYVEDEKSIPSDAVNKLIELTQKSPGNSYLIRDIEEGVLNIEFKIAKGIKEFYAKSGERFKIFQLL